MPVLLLQDDSHPRCGAPCEHRRHEKEYVKAAVLKDEIPHCRECNGIVKPCITFFGVQ